MARPLALVERLEPVGQDLDVGVARRVLDVEAQRADEAILVSLKTLAG
jgi:hypothetical protein